MKLLITGGAGFVGTNLIADLTERGGYDITVIDNETLGSRESLRPYPVRFVHADIRDKEALRDVMRGQDGVVHLAADTRVMDSIEDPRFNFDNNVVATFGLLEVAREFGVERIVNASTGGAILGEAPAPVHEEMVPRPLAPYGASKLAAEGYLNAFAATYGLKTCSLRFSNVYGPRSFHKGSVVAHFLKRVLAGEPLTVYGDGSQVRDYLFAMDLTDGIRKAIEQGVTGVHQLGSGKPTTINELIGIIEDVTGKRMSVSYADFRPGEVHTTYCNVSKAMREFDFAPTTPLHEGIAQTWQWFTDNAKSVAA
jgi:UDP-glucose 4-epimerase